MATQHPPSSVPRWHQRLYWRIWLTVAALVALAVVAVATLWRLDLDNDRAQRVGRELLVRSLDGAVIGQARILNGPERQALRQQLRGQLPSQSGRDGHDSDHGSGERDDGSGQRDHHEDDDERRAPSGPVFELQLQDGQTVLLELPRPKHVRGDGAWPDARQVAYVLTTPVGWAAVAALLVALIALLAYPVVRRLTRRLERLQQGVQRFGSGDLSARVDERGGDEVAYLARQFNDTAARVEALVNSHKSLLANASHELRSPLARIRMSMALLPDTSGSEAAAMARAEIEQSITELDELIGEILLASRLDHGGAAAEPKTDVNLADLLTQECARLGLLAEVSAQPFGDTDHNWLVKGHAHLLRRMMRNLLENAQRHGQAGSQAVGVQVKARLWRDAAHAICLSVSDNGPGVPVALRERIFEPFFRLPGASEREGGVGLGLALVKAIAREHSATVQCTQASAAGEITAGDLSGALFVVSWPSD